jgi:hypothetical protein
MTENPFQPDRAYPTDEFLARAGIGRTTMYALLGSGKLHARKITERKTVITNAHPWFEALPSYQGGQSFGRVGSQSQQP